ncbi:MAG: hypothetical protein COA82_07935 [Alkaliphilus sp.]|nr:MAG: hypothetical protein COA82_07935 [Alkaliphilus sp.]
MKYIICVIIGLMVITILGCDSSNSSEGNNARFEVYIGEQDTLSGEYILRDKPVFTDEDIKSYEWDMQIIKFKQEYLDQLDVPNIKDKYYIGGSRLLGTQASDKFYIYINDELIYDGFFMQSMVSSFYPIGAVIFDVKDGIQIRHNDIIGGKTKDLRYDGRIKDVMKTKGLF